MDVVVPLGKGSLHQNLELRYCLRSIETHVNNVGNIFIIGERPAFLDNIIHINVIDNSSREQKEANIFRKIVAACQDKRVSEDFYFFNDDHFLTVPFEEHYYHSGPLNIYIDQLKVRQSHFKTLMNTYVALKGGKHFDVHCPITYNKQRFMETVGTCNWSISYGYGIKSLYCNMSGIAGMFIQDLKIKMDLTKMEIYRLIGKRRFFSIGDTALNQSMKQVLHELYPQQSKYEKY